MQRGRPPKVKQPPDPHLGEILSVFDQINDITRRGRKRVIQYLFVQGYRMSKLAEKTGYSRQYIESIVKEGKARPTQQKPDRNS